MIIFQRIVFGRIEARRLKNMEHESNRPSYLKKYKSGSRSFFVSGIILLLLGLLNPIILILAAVFFILGIIKIRQSKNNINLALDKGIEFYEKKDFENSKIELKKALQFDKKNTKAIIVLALANYETKCYKESIQLLESIPADKISQELDISIKLVEAYLIEKQYEKAEKILIRLQKIQPKSEYIAETLKKCKASESK